MSRPILRCLLLTMALCGWSAALADEALGRLFFTPERRAALERQRQFNIQEAQTLEGSTVRLDGVIQRSDGDRTVWINGRAQRNNASASGVVVKVTPGNPSRAALTTDNERPADLKVGETINRATREKQDGLDGGTLVVKPPPAQH